MSISRLARFGLISPVVIWVALLGARVITQEQAPVNSGPQPNPYRVVRDWGKLPDRPWGGSNGVAIDRDGKSVWAVDRCSPGTNPGCLGSKANPVHKFDESGKEVRSFGAGMFVWPHGLHVDRDVNIWVADSVAVPSPEALKKFPGEANKGSYVVSLSEGKVLMTLASRSSPATTPPLTEPPTSCPIRATATSTWPEPHQRREPELSDDLGVRRNGRFLRTIGKTAPDRASSGRRTRWCSLRAGCRRRPPQSPHSDPYEKASSSGSTRSSAA